MPSSTPTVATRTSALSVSVPTRSCRDSAAAWRSHTGTNIRPRPSTASPFRANDNRQPEATGPDLSAHPGSEHLDRRGGKPDPADPLKTDDGPRPPERLRLVTQVGEVAESGADAGIVHQPTPASSAAAGD